MAEQVNQGVFLGRTRVAKKSKVGGARHVFAQIQGLKNDLVFAPFGGVVANPFPGPAKMYAGDLCWIKYDDKCENPELYLLKTYKVAQVFEHPGTGAHEQIIENDGYRHRPFPGDFLGKPSEFIGEVCDEAHRVIKVTDIVTNLGEGRFGRGWLVEFDDAWKDITPNDILVEADPNEEEGGLHPMLVKEINACLPCDYDFVYDADFASEMTVDGYPEADYALTPVAGMLAYTHRMSPLPKCVLDLNEAKWNGLFKIGSWI